MELDQSCHWRLHDLANSESATFSCKGKFGAVVVGNAANEMDGKVGGAGIVNANNVATEELLEAINEK